MLEQLLSDPKERAVHAGTVHRLAAESGLPEANVESLYEQALGRLMRTARVKDFLPILTGRIVKENLQTGGLEARAGR
jgi:hypothetical protein